MGVRRMHNISARKWYTRAAAWVAADSARNPAFTFIPIAYLDADFAWNSSEI